MRADQLLLERGLAATRSQAQRLIAAGVLWRTSTGTGTGTGTGNWQAVRKNGDDLPLQAELQLQDAAESRYASRGGLKLQGALQAVGLDVRGWRCLDVGQSTGGFTDCLLQHGAAHVTGLDVGTGQLHPRLRADARVQAHEGINARDPQALLAALGSPVQQAVATPEASTNVIAEVNTEVNTAANAKAKANAPSAGFDLLVGDLSFISQTLVLPALRPYLRPAGHVLMLVKPQFELQPQHIGKGGIVKDAALYAQVEQRLRQCCGTLGLQVLHWLPSSITGGDGNREFFIHARA